MILVWVALGLVEGFTSLGRDTLRFNSFCGPLSVPAGNPRFLKKIRFAFLADSVVVNNLPRLPVRFDTELSHLVVQLTKQVSAFLWAYGLITSWLTWWSSQFTMKFDPLLGVLVYQQSDNTNLVFSQDACNPFRNSSVETHISPLALSPPLGDYCGIIFRGKPEATVTFSTTHIAFLGVIIPFVMDGQIIHFDSTHEGYLDFLTRFNLGRPSNNLYTAHQGLVKAEVGRRKFSLIPCGSEKPRGKFCHRASPLTTIVLEGLDEVRLSVASPIFRKVFARPVTVSDGGDRTHVGLSLCRQIGWDCSTFKVSRFGPESIHIDIGTRIVLFRSC